MSLDVYLYARTRHHCSKCGHEDLVPTEVCVFSANITHNLGRMAKVAGCYEACWRPEELMDEELASKIRELEDRYFADRGPHTRPFYDEAQVLREKLPRASARDIRPLLHQAVERLRADPAKFTPLNPDNGWGDYDGLVRWLERYLAACDEHPDAIIEVSR
jgi:hypothetical protein